MSETGAPFDTERYLRNSRRIDLSDIPWEAVPDHPLNNGELTFLQYAMEIEDHTIVYLKEILGTSAIQDEEVTAFLSCWAYEEHFHGRALERFLQAYLGPDAPRRDLLGRIQKESRLRKFAKATLMPVLSRLVPDFPAIHMTWGATNELTTLTGYEQLIRKTRHPILKEILTRIVKDERRHFAFYYQQAKRRLAGDARTRRITRRLMERAWRPVGSAVYDPIQVDEVGAYVFGDAKGRLAMRKATATIAALPGMEGWDRLDREMEGAMHRNRARHATQSVAIA